MRIRGGLLGTALVGALALGATVPANAQDGQPTVMRDITYRSVGGTSLAFDAYLPSGAGPHPAVIVIPGGRWTYATKEDKTWLPVDLANAGYVAFAVDYRPATDAPFPAAIEDVQAAVRYIRAHASRFDIDPTRFGAVGGSAGGHLAALLDTWGEGPTDAGARVNVAVSWSGPMDLVRLLDDPSTELRTAVRRFLGCSASEGCIDQARAASPIEHVDPTDGAVFLGHFTGEDIPVDQATRMAAVLERNGIPMRLVEPEANNHGLGRNEKTLNYVTQFLGTWIDGGSAGAPSPSTSTGKQGSATGSSGAPTPGRATKNTGATKPTTRIETTPWWAIAAVVIAVLAAIASLLVSIALYRRLRAEGRTEAPDEAEPSASEPLDPEASSTHPSERHS